MSQNIKLLFLDIDGVVNTGRSMTFLDKPAEKNDNGDFIWNFDPMCALAVRKIVQHTGCKVVINSTHGGDEDLLREMFLKVGYDIAEDFFIRWSTGYPNNNMERAESIRECIRNIEHPDNAFPCNVTHMCVLDDFDMRKSFSWRQVLVDPVEGITYKDFLQVCEIFEKPFKEIVLI